MHKVADSVRSAVSIPLLHIGEVTAAELLAAGVRKTALLGTAYTMEQDFYTAKLVEKGIEALIPDAEQRRAINEIIYSELCQGIIREESRAYFYEVIDGMKERGAEGVILGCTEIGLLVQAKESPLPVFDTTLIHARRAALLSLGGKLTP